MCRTDLLYLQQPANPSQAAAEEEALRSPAVWIALSNVSWGSGLFVTSESYEEYVTEWKFKLKHLVIHLPVGFENKNLKRKLILE